MEGQREERKTKSDRTGVLPGRGKMAKKWMQKDEDGKGEENMNTKRTGTVARLPKEERHEVSKMLHNGATYREVITAMAVKGIRLQKNALTTWLRGGHQDWLGMEERLINIDRLREFATRVVESNEGTMVQQAAMKVASAQIYELLMNYDPKSLKERLKEGDTSDYAMLVNVMARLSDGGLKQERYRDDKAELAKHIAAGKKNGFTPEVIAKMEEALHMF